MLLPYSAGCQESCDLGCYDIYDPVCGSDGNTYSNSCELEVVDCLSPENITMVGNNREESTSCGCLYVLLIYSLYIYTLSVHVNMSLSLAGWPCLNSLQELLSRPTTTSSPPSYTRFPYYLSIPSLHLSSSFPLFHSHNYVLLLILSLSIRSI